MGGFPDYQAQLDFMVQVHAFGADDGAGFGEEDGGGWFEEEEGLRGARGRELGYVVAGSQVSMRIVGEEGCGKVIGRGATYA